jgi:purine nucleosidase/pyrimidine-specific ribonucleoside hydrolase
LILALRSPELDVLAITAVAGNVPLERCVRNAAGIVSLLGAPAPVAAGCGKPLEREPVLAQVHGADGVGGASGLLPAGRPVLPLPAPMVILEAAERHPGEVTLVALGPLTNLATAALADPARFARLARIVSMGGAFQVPGNITAVAEFNFFADPHAAGIVLASGVPVMFVGLDVTTKVCLTPELLPSRTASANDRILSFVEKAALHFLNSSRDYGCHLHDPLAVAAVIDPSLAETRPVFVEVETSGQATLGMTVADLRPWSTGTPNARVCVGVDAPRFLDLFARRVLRG